MKPDQLSQTAAFIAIKFYGLTNMEPYRSLFHEATVEFYDRLVTELPSPLNRYHRLLKSPWLRKFFIFSEELLLPGDLMHILMRKRYIGNMVERLVKEGYEQLVVLGSGFDHLAVKHSRQGILSFEIDAPGMADLKGDFIGKYNYCNTGLQVIPAYFSRDTLGTILARHIDIDANKKTIIVAEGFFDYLTPRQSETLLKDLATYFNRNISLISTVFSLTELSLLRSWVFQLGVWMVGEKLKLHQTYSEFSKMLGDYNFEVVQHIDTEDMQIELAKKNIALPILPGFHLVQADSK